MGLRSCRLAMLFPTGSASANMLQFYCPLGKDRSNLELSAHGFNYPSQRTHAHVGPPFHPRNGHLAHFHQFRQLFLRQFQRLSQFIQRHLFDVLGIQLYNLRALWNVKREASFLPSPPRAEEIPTLCRRRKAWATPTLLVQLSCATRQRAVRAQPSSDAL